MAFSKLRGVAALGTMAAGVFLAVAGCTIMQESGSHAASTAPATGPAAAKGNAYLASKGDAQLWQQTCSRCHNLRDPATYSDAQWNVAMFDMRVRAQLTGEEQRRILAFMKSANKN